MTRTNVLDMINMSKGVSDMQNFLIRYRGVILVLLVLLLGYEMMSINVRMLEQTETKNIVDIYN